MRIKGRITLKKIIYILGLLILTLSLTACISFDDDGGDSANSEGLISHPSADVTLKIVLGF